MLTAYKLTSSQTKQSSTDPINLNVNKTKHFKFVSIFTKTPEPLRYFLTRKSENNRNFSFLYILAHMPFDQEYILSLADCQSEVNRVSGRVIQSIPPYALCPLHLLSFCMCPWILCRFSFQYLLCACHTSLWNLPLRWGKVQSWNSFELSNLPVLPNRLKRCGLNLNADLMQRNWTARCGKRAGTISEQTVAAYLWHWMPLQTNKQLSSSWEQYWSQLTWCLGFVSTQLPGQLGKQLVACGTAQLSAVPLPKSCTKHFIGLNTEPEQDQKPTQYWLHSPPMKNENWIAA